MDPQTVRDVVPHFDANLLGIDIFELEKERFFGPDHEKLMVQHQEQVQHFEIKKQFAEFEGHLNELGEMWRRKERIRRERIRASKSLKHYAFSDKQMEIAMRSFDAKDPM
jgi:hypothetical protein